MEHIVVGTAGHIDHGKTSLIKALTGYDTDRLIEEKRRGITIELGFTDFNLPDGRKVGIVDVPGHEKFIKNMAAGVVGMDLVLLIIAADEGIMPQTREHADILHMLGVKKSIIVLNKIDLVEPEWMELVEEEIKDAFKDTFLEDAPIVRVSARDGNGIGELITWIEHMTKEEIQPRDTRTIPRLPIDRVFTISGYGTVVTGTLISGTIAKEDVLTIYPSGIECRVRNIQVHGADKEQCYAGQRVAINLANIKKEEIKRGSVLALPNSMKSTQLLDVKIDVLDSAVRILKNNARLHLLTGTDEVLCRVVLLNQEELKPGESGYAQLRLEKEIAVRRKDKFVIRFYSPVETIGGGIILEPNATKKKRFRDEAIKELIKKEEGSFADILELHLKNNIDNLMTIQDLAKLTAYAEEEVEEEINALNKEGIVLTFPMKNEVYVWHMDSYRAALRTLLTIIKEYELRYPYRMGMKKAQLQRMCFAKVKQNLCDRLFEKMENDNYICRKNDLIYRTGFTVRKDAVFEKISKIYINTFENAEYEFLTIKEIVFPNDVKEYAEDILEFLVCEQYVVKINESVYTMKSLMDRAERRIKLYFEDNKIITTVQVKEMFNVSRKNAKLIIEYMDNKKITRKTGGETERIRY